jgi:GntR family transcriptional regulator / MocR family aminotransferase
MQIALSKTSDVPLRQQLTEQIVFLITTGQLHLGEELPSVRALARMSKVHHNTVSEAYAIWCAEAGPRADLGAGCWSARAQAQAWPRLVRAIWMS